MRSSRQQELVFRTRGGKREGAGRKPTGPKAGVRHRSRARLDGRTPVHITLRVLPDAPRLRRRTQYQQIRKSLARCGHQDRFRITHYSVQGNHLHLIAEPLDEVAMGKAMKGFASSMARRLNRTVGRKGRLFSDRYHARYLRTPAEVRRAICYVMNNWRHHGEHRRHPDWRTDPFSSADAFDGWTCGPVAPPSRDGPAPVAPPRYWLLTTGWRRRHPLIGPREIPGPRS